jgi:hypothetical protein
MTVVAPIGNEPEERKFNETDDYLDGLIRDRSQRATEPHRLESSDDEECFDLYSAYLFDIVETHLLPEPLRRIGNFFANYVLPDVLNVDFKVSKLNLSGNKNEETCAFTGLLIRENTAYAVKCFAPADDKIPLNAFIISDDGKGLNVIVSFIKAIKYYKQMIEMRMDGTCKCSFKDDGGLFTKNFIQLRLFKKFISP